jgi:alkylation response protein AidB-like acyl-CoA dehydrogenase
MGGIMAEASSRSVGTPDAVAAAQRLAPQIIAAREETERLRHVPASLADALADLGLYQLFLPRSVGGAETPPLIVFAAIEEISRADGSIGWCALNANIVALAAGWLAPEVGRQLFGVPPDLRGAGSFRPLGRARPTDGGYIVNGRWNFASGVHNANMLYCTCIVMDGEKPKLTPAGTSVTRTMWIPSGPATIVDTWSVIGMRGSGSDDFVIADHFVPDAHTHSLAEPARDAGPLYRQRPFFTLVFSLFAANALGIARGAIDAFADMATREATTSSTTLLRDRPLVQGRLAQAEAIVSGARCFLMNSLAQLWSETVENKSDLSMEIARARLAIPHAILESVRAVDLVFHTAGTNAIYTADPLERHFRDIHVCAQHNAAFPIHFESAGKVLLGLRPTEPGW